MMKGFTPGLTLMVAVLTKRERLTGPLVAAIAMICTGTAAAALLEGRTERYSLVGMAWMAASSLCEALRVVMIQAVAQARTPTPACSSLVRGSSSVQRSRNINSNSVQCGGNGSNGVQFHSTGNSSGSMQRRGNGRSAAPQAAGLNLAETLVLVSGPAAVVLAALSVCVERAGVVAALWAPRGAAADALGAAADAPRMPRGTLAWLLAAIAASSLLTNLAGYGAVQVRSVLHARVLSSAAPQVSGLGRESCAAAAHGLFRNALCTAPWQLCAGDVVSDVQGGGCGEEPCGHRWRRRDGRCNLPLAAGRLHGLLCWHAVLQRCAAPHACAHMGAQRQGGLMPMQMQ
jgi:hypothetical protein